MSGPEVLVAALRAIVDMEPEPFDLPADWDQQVAACEECKRWKDHPIQQGICDTHRQPLRDRDAHVRSEQLRLHDRMRSVAREALDAYVLAPAPAEATEPSAPEGATWGDVRSGLRAELIAEGMPITKATRIARKVVHRFSAAEATEGSES